MPNHNNSNKTNNHNEQITVNTVTKFPRLPDLDCTDTVHLRNEIRNYFLVSFARYESLFEIIAKPEGWYQKAIPLRHPLIFYFGHTATFFVNKLFLARLIRERVNPKFEALFAVGVDEMSWDDLNEAHFAWPTIAEVKHYREQVKQLILNLIDNELVFPLNWNSPWWALLMGIEHELIHLETSSVLIRQLHISLVQTHHKWQPCPINSTAPQNNLVTVQAGTINLAKGHTDPHYGWDNEYGNHCASINEFQASQYLVSNQEFLEFVNNGGYSNPEYWEKEGWSWQNFSGSSHPAFWVLHDENWWLRVMAEEITMPWSWPVEVNYHEAKAFCNWKKSLSGLSVRLPSEDEWYRLRLDSDLELLPTNNYLDYYASPCPVDMFAHGKFYDISGNVWQWSETPIYPFENFEVHPLYDDFTLPTFDNQHNLIKGSSWISCGNETQLSARYAFRRHFFQHAGFRYVVADELCQTAISTYESDKLLAEYSEFHYGAKYFGVENFSKTLAEIAFSACPCHSRKKALDIGCAVGRATFELAKHFEAVDGIDFSARFINMGVQLKSGKTLRYAITSEGELCEYKNISLATLGLENSAQRVNFMQGDACNLKPHHRDYDLILAANLIDRLINPSKFLADIRLRLNLGGILVLASPYTWLEEYTPKENWLGGLKVNGENYTTLAALKDILSENFQPVSEAQEVAFVIRETARKFQHSIAQISIWQRVS